MEKNQRKAMNRDLMLGDKVNEKGLEKEPSVNLVDL
jgi:hypothetical protein